MCIYNNANTRQFERTIISYTISIQVFVPPSRPPLLPNDLLKMNHNGKALSPLMRATYAAVIASTQKCINYAFKFTPCACRKPEHTKINKSRAMRCKSPVRCIHGTLHVINCSKRCLYKVQQVNFHTAQHARICCTKEFCII